jgi:hypothetical protein
LKNIAKTLILNVYQQKAGQYHSLWFCFETQTGDNKSRFAYIQI